MSETNNDAGCWPALVVLGLFSINIIDGCSIRELQKDVKQLKADNADLRRIVAQSQPD